MICLLFRYKGIDINGDYKKGFIESETNIQALKVLKSKENLLVVIALHKQTNNPAIIKLSKAIEKNFSKKKKIKEKHKNDVNIKNKKKSLFTKINDLKFPFKKETNIEMNEEMYDKILNIFKNQETNTQAQASDTNLKTNVGINIEVNKNLKTKDEAILDKKNKSKEKELNWDLFRPESNLKAKKIKVKEKDIIFFTRRLQIMLSSGITLIKSLLILSKTKNKDMNYMINSIIDDIQAGNSFSEALSKFPKQFNYFYIALVSIGESSGTLDSVLLDILEDKEQKQKIAKKLKTAAIYPTIIGIVVGIILVIGSIYFIPTFKGMFLEQGIDLPFITKIVFKFADILPIAISAISIILISFKALRKSNIEVEMFYRKHKDRLVLKLPIIKNIVKISSMYNFSSTISLMLKNGIRLKDALLLAERTINNIYIKSEVNEIIDLMIQGFTFSEAISKQEHFDELISNIILTGEESGQLTSSLKQISMYYSEELTKSIEKMIEFIQPMLVILMALIIIPVVLAIYLPILDISSGALLDM